MLPPGTSTREPLVPRDPQRRRGPQDGFWVFGRQQKTRRLAPSQHIRPLQPPGYSVRDCAAGHGKRLKSIKSIQARCQTKARMRAGSFGTAMSLKAQ